MWRKLSCCRIIALWLAAIIGSFSHQACRSAAGLEGKTGKYMYAACRRSSFACPIAPRLSYELLLFHLEALSFLEVQISHQQRSMATKWRLRSKPSPAPDDAVTAVFLDQEKPSESKSGSESLRSSSWKRLLFNTWVPEILAVIFSVGCIAALAVVLLTFNGRPAPQMRWGLTLNALISILATASKAALLAVVAAVISQLKWCWFSSDSRKLQDLQSFDDASRGVFGSILLLLGLQGRYLASIGAVVTILALAFDPFLQQVVKYPSRGISVPSNATTTRMASTFSLSGVNATGPAFESLQYIGAINAGPWSDSTQFERYPNCPSENCTWPSFQSVGWCSKCANAISSVVFNGECQSQGLYWAQGNVNCSLGFGQGNNISIVDPTVSSQDNATHCTTEQSLVWAVHSTNQSVSTSEPGYPMATTEYLGIENPLMVFGYVSLATNLSLNTPRVPPTIEIVRAEQCVLTPCLREYEISTPGGIPTVKVVDIDYGSIVYWLPEGESNLPQTCWQASGNNVTYVWNEPCESNDSFCVDEAANASAPAFCPAGVYQQALIDRLSGNTSTVNVYNNTLLDSSTTPAPDVLQVVQSDNLTSLMGNMAASLTKLGLRLSNETVMGNVTVSEVYVVVDWEWMILPAVLEVAGVILLLATMMMTQRHNVSLWKTSSLALIYHGLEGRSLRNQDVAQDVCGMSLAAGTTVVKLGTADEDGRVALVEVVEHDHGAAKLTAGDSGSDCEEPDGGSTRR